MKKLKLYLDTSVWNFLFADDAPEKKEITLEFFKRVEENFYEIYISGVVLEEINKANEDLKLRLLKEIEIYQPTNLEITEEIENLAQKYIQNDVTPENKRNDARHIAITAVNELDALISWNFKHLANLNVKNKALSVNIKEGYLKEIEMITPMEVI